jgi:hypothetical protein
LKEIKRAAKPPLNHFLGRPLFSFSIFSILLLYFSFIYLSSTRKSSRVTSSSRKKKDSFMIIIIIIFEGRLLAANYRH